MFRFKTGLTGSQREKIRGGIGKALQVDYVGRGEMPGIGFISCITLEPGASVGEHSHPETGEFYLVIEGEGEGILDGRRERVSTGDAFFLNPGESHGLVNTGASPLEFLAVLTSPDPCDAVATEVLGKRDAEGDIMALFLNRWSPRSFLSEPVDEEDLAICFEAARWAPSSYNEQPWRFVFARNREDLDRFLDCLSEFNREWARGAPLLVALCAKKDFTHNSTPNRHSWFDVGAAWMAFSLEARRRGWSTHAMAGFDADLAQAALSLPEGFEVVCFIAMGKRGREDSLPDAAKKMESPNGRNSRCSFVFEGRFPDPDRTSG